MRTLKINKGNWSGEEADIQIVSKTEMIIPEYDIRVKLVNRHRDKKLSWELWSVEIKDSGGWNGTDYDVYKFDDDDYWTAKGHGIVREGTSPLVALAKVIFTTM